MRYFATGAALILAFLAGALTCAYLPLGYLEDGDLVGDLKLSTVNLGDKPYYALTGYYGSALGSLGDVTLLVGRKSCNIRIERALLNHGQRSGHFAYLFDAKPKCSRITFGKKQSPL